jgi:hypothetical protein
MWLSLRGAASAVAKRRGVDPQTVMITIAEAAKILDEKGSQ